jgi:hypothetical protein
MLNCSVVQEMIVFVAPIYWLLTRRRVTICVWLNVKSQNGRCMKSMFGFRFDTCNYGSLKLSMLN